MAAVLAALLVGDWCLGIGMALGVFIGLYFVLIMFNRVEQGTIQKTEYKPPQKQRSDDHGTRRLPGPHFRPRRRR